ncbi:DUF1624 domain-containing protein [Lentisphaera araneosa]
MSSIDWMRGFVMILMLVDHVSMVYNKDHLATDSAISYIPGSALPAWEFFTRWTAHLCTPVFVFLAGTAMALSIERKVAKGIDSSQINKDILIRGAFIAILDPTLISLFAGKFLFQVLYAIGLAMMCMAFFRHLSSKLLIILALSWFTFGELLNGIYFPPGESTQSIFNAFFFSSYTSTNLVIKYPLLPWLAMMILGWVFGRYLLDYKEGRNSVGPVKLLLSLGFVSLMAFAALRYYNGYGNMFLLREDHSWQHWLHVSKYPPSATYTLLELGLMMVLMALMICVERLIGTRQNGILLVLGQTAMFFYLVHRLVLVGVANLFDLYQVSDLYTTYIISAVFLAILYPLCIWYRSYKAKNVKKSVYLKYL